MAATYYTLLTTIGQARIANAVALGEMVNLTNMAVGDGNGNPTTPNENQTALVRERYRAAINQLTVDPSNPNYIIAEMIVPTNVGGWSVNEVGVFDDQGQLIAVANFPATYKPVIADGSGRDLIIRIIIQVSNSSVVTLKIDPAVVLASQAWVAANYVKKVTVAGGTTGQVLVKKSNANEDFQWVDPTAAVDVNVFSREETQTLAASQVIIDLATLTTDGAAVYVEGVRLRDNQFTVNSSTRLTLATSYPAGTKVTVVQNEETSRNAFMLKANNLSDLTDKALARSNLGLPDAIGGRFLRRRFITASGTFTPTADAKIIKVRVIGGGGGGGAAGNTGTGYTAIGGGGGGGGYSEKYISITAGFSPVSVTIGSGGIPGGQSGYAGGAGGSTSFGSYCSASGGDGGAGTAATNNSSYLMSGGSGGLGSNGEVNAFGQSGSAAIMQTVNGGISGAGGASIMSAGPGGRVGNAGGNDGIYGSGASGGISQVSASTQYGGRGGSGIVIVEEYS